MEKDFDRWHKVKSQLDDTERTTPLLFKTREVWWCSVGLNIGFEIYGKDDFFLRPVLILRKYNKLTFFGLPMTSRRKDSFFRFPLDFEGKRGDVILDQGRTFDAKRLSDRMGKIMPHNFEKIKKAFKDTL